ncbi:hypothetical protein MNBD_GAMMA01-1541 [hydrothermal vent metagenome]|uniref:Uncharacterized protein n=1 Tax=hydrothermal vent metagenome TaxID=652676 RepID=A0A3B0V481_9ZZZZ
MKKILTLLLILTVFIVSANNTLNSDETSSSVQQNNSLESIYSTFKLSKPKVNPTIKSWHGCPPDPFNQMNNCYCNPLIGIVVCRLK